MARTYNHILLTGATGALGPALGAELARHGAAERIAVLMRGGPRDINARFQRWIGAVRDLLSPEDHGAAARLYPVAGDICEAGLGMAADGSRADLRSGTDLVIHAAADTNFSAEPEQQWAVNVGGTQRMLEWAAECPHLGRFLLVSSVFVSGSRTGRIDEIATEHPPEFVTYYQRTKWESERVALASALPVGIARISMVLGSHATGGVHRTGAVHSLIKWFARGLVPVVPGSVAARGDVIATELAARSLARAVTAEWREPRPIWHIAASETAPRMAELIDFVYEHFAARAAWRRKNIPRPRMVEQGVFDQLIGSVDAEGHTVVAQALRSVNRFLPDLLYPKTYVTTQAQALWGGALPQYDWRETMERVIRFCCPPEK
ncbi:MAG TPA: SDR family oxidoreductase [Phycisphaerae bacterium]|nr:SDR family oxidoreductase [Phycisphaerae bacterium]